MNEKFQSLVGALEGHFDKSYSDLLDDTKQRINKHWFPFGQFGDENIPADMWDSSSPEGRRDTAYQYDYQNDPKFEPERQHQENLLGQQWELEDKIRSLQQMNPQAPLEYESKERQLAEAKAELEQINREWDLPAPLPENTRQHQEPDPTDRKPAHGHKDKAEREPVQQKRERRLRQWLDGQGIPEDRRHPLESFTLREIYNALSEFPEFRSDHGAGLPIDFSTFKRHFWKKQNIAKLTNLADKGDNHP